jgi:hypothetical protein
MSNLQIDLRQPYAIFTSARQPYIRWPANALIYCLGLYYVFRTKCSKWASIFSQLPIINTRFLYGWRPRKTLLLYVKLSCETKKKPLATGANNGRPL